MIMEKAWWGGYKSQKIKNKQGVMVGESKTAERTTAKYWRTRYNPFTGEEEQSTEEFRVTLEEIDRDIASLQRDLDDVQEFRADFIEATKHL
jgi:hypothetical protein